MATTLWDKFRNGWRNYNNMPSKDYSQRRHDRKVDKGKIQGDVSGFGDIFDKYGSVGADENGERNSKSIGRGAQFSNTQLAEMQFNHDEAQADRDWNEQMYQKYQSPAAQVRQYQEAGLNTALMYNGGVDINGPSGGSAASVSGAQGGEDPQSGFERVMGVMSQFMQMMIGGSQIASSVKETMNQTKSTNADAALKEAQTEGTRVQTNNNILEGKLKELDLEYKSKFYDLDIKEQEERIDNLRKQGLKIMSDIDVNNSVIELNGAQVDLTHSLTNKAEKEAALLVSQKFLTDLNAHQVQILMPLIEKKTQSEIELNYAVTDAQKADAQNKIAQANLAIMNEAKEKHIIDSGYYEERVKDMKSERRRAVADCVVGNICDIVRAGVGVMTGTAALGKKSRSPIEAPSQPGPRALIDANGNVLYSIN